jgi:hypothetical protein
VIALDRIQAALMLFGGLVGAAYCLGMVWAYYRRRPVLRNLGRQTWGRR